MTVPSSSGVDVAIHHLSIGAGRRPLLVSHATGFHGLVYAPLAATLADEFDVWALDHRGHGATAAPPGWDGRWEIYGDDAEAAAVWLAGRSGSGDGVVGFGHSMGGATLLMTADRHPGLFSLLVLFEPIVAPPQPPTFDPETSPLVVGARRRRRRFDSAEAARRNFSSKPPMNGFDGAAVDAYVAGGFAAVDPEEPNGPVVLLCEPEVEAATFANGFWHDTWSRIDGIEVPTVVVAGAGHEEGGPAGLAPAIAERLPNGRLEMHEELDHFGPFTHPDRVGAIIRRAAS